MVKMKNKFNHFMLNLFYLLFVRLKLVNTHFNLFYIIKKIL